NGLAGENDSVNVVFIPEGTPNVTMGQVGPTGETFFKQGDFTVTMVGQPELDGTFRITIPGESPATGTLIATPNTRLASATEDNPIFVQPDGDTWLVETRDIESTTILLQDLDTGDIVFSFAFFKNGVEIHPGTPSGTWRTRTNTVASARIRATEFN